MWTPFKAMASLIEQIAANTSATRQNTVALDSNTLALDTNSAIGARTNRLLERVLDLLRYLPDPGPLSIFVTKEFENMLTFNIQLPAEPEGFTDIASGKLTLRIGDGEEQAIETAKGQSLVEGLQGAQGASVNASFAYVDDAGNLSKSPSSLGGVLADTFPPPNPGELGILVTGEVPDPA